MRAVRTEQRGMAGDDACRYGGQRATTLPVELAQVTRQVGTQLRSVRRPLLWVYIPASVGLGLLVWASIVTEIPMADFTRDPMAVAGGPVYAGLLSNLGVIAWSAAAALCLYNASLLYALRVKRDVAALLFSAGLFSLLLMLDDLFMFHERAFPNLLGIRERYVIAVYGLLMMALLAAHYRAILRTAFVVFVLAGGMFFMSLAVDRLPEDLLPMHHLFEDGCKFLGILTWLLYFAHTSMAAVTAALKN